MKAMHLMLVGVLALGAAACNKKPEAEAPAAKQPAVGETHSASGVIKEFGEGNKTVVIAHEAFPDGFMEAMTMSFELESPDLAKGLKKDDKVEFTLTYRGNGFPVTSLKKVK